MELIATIKIAARMRTVSALVPVSASTSFASQNVAHSGTSKMVASCAMLTKS